MIKQTIPLPPVVIAQLEKEYIDFSVQHLTPVPEQKSTFLETLKQHKFDDREEIEDSPKNTSSFRLSTNSGKRTDFSGSESLFSICPTMSRSENHVRQSKDLLLLGDTKKHPHGLYDQPDIYSQDMKYGIEHLRDGGLNEAEGSNKHSEQKGEDIIIPAGRSYHCKRSVS
eukprot:TRINITY_DN14665_c0_g1_i1.p1 TRINITY_DN14665_c0_g1~~TRINITY_DN14665_c0_g1_i1.p1  ORF type:complete len:170 (-),score=17.88 TRINITY_DN14665_c0_g1_i1:254-763(-)